MPSNLDRLKAAYTAWNDTKGESRDVWGALMADRFRLSHVDESSPGLEFAKDSVTRDEALVYLTAIFDEWEMVHYTPELYVGDGDAIAMFGKCAFRHRKAGKEAEMTMACLWRFEGDEAVSMTEVFDSAVAMRGSRWRRSADRGARSSLLPLREKVAEPERSAGEVG